jgi:hypothetical protein
MDITLPVTRLITNEEKENELGCRGLRGWEEEAFY